VKWEEAYFDFSEQIEELHKKIEKLEKQIKNLELKLQKFAYSRVEIPKTFPRLKKIPKGWKEFEYEGLKYYLIPLKNDSRNTELQKK
jgi:predicted  nucleic acid-binding Zn-ribbon protein